jgi:alpha-beta hydrolase superfamily lysophospholipase
MLHKEGKFKGLKDFNIYYQNWLPEKKPRAVLLVAHGFAEHQQHAGRPHHGNRPRCPQEVS